MAANALNYKQPLKYDDLADIFQKTDSFEPVLFEKLVKTIKNELPPVNAEEKKIFSDFDMMLEEIEMLCQCNKIRKHSLKSQDSGERQGEEDNIDEEKVCNICYYNEKDTIFEPCGHQTCTKCIQVHMLNSERCPFCNVVIQQTKKTQ